MMGELRAIAKPDKPPCPWCEETGHGFRACPRVRRMQFFGGTYEDHYDIQAVEFWPDDAFEFDIPDDELLMAEPVEVDE